MEKPDAWFTPRTYLHFDLPVAPRNAKQIVEIPAKVAKHSFYPFISFEIHSEKVVKDSDRIRKKSKIRPIAYASHVDSQIYSFYNSQLSVLYEQRLAQNSLHENILAFRKLKRNNVDFAKNAFEKISEFDDCHVIASDITKFFDNINHDILKHEWMKLLGVDRLPKDHFVVYESLTRHSKVDKRRLFKAMNLPLRNPRRLLNERRICKPEEYRRVVRGGGLIETNKSSHGIPQGSPISALLSNIYLLDFDTLIAAEVRKVGGYYFRYCDDLLLIVPSNPKYFEDLVRNTLLNDFKLTAHPDKTDVQRFQRKGAVQRATKPIQYLGFIFDGQRILLRSAALARFSSKMKKSIYVAKKSMDKANAERAQAGKKPHKLYLKKIYQKFSYLGKRNLISYALKASRTMESPGIKKQLKPLWQRLQKEIKRDVR